MTARIECRECGTDWSPTCSHATGPSWDPTVGIRPEDVERRLRTGAFR